MPWLLQAQAQAQLVASACSDTSAHGPQSFPLASTLGPGQLLQQHRPPQPCRCKDAGVSMHLHIGACTAAAQSFYLALELARRPWRAVVAAQTAAALHVQGGWHDQRCSLRPALLLTAYAAKQAAEPAGGSASQAMDIDRPQRKRPASPRAQVPAEAAPSGARLSSSPGSKGGSQAHQAPTSPARRATARAAA